MTWGIEWCEVESLIGTPLRCSLRHTCIKSHDCVSHDTYSCLRCHECHLQTSASSFRFAQPPSGHLVFNRTALSNLLSFPRASEYPVFKMSAPSITNYIVKRPWLKRWMTPLANWYTDAAGYRKLGLK